VICVQPRGRVGIRRARKAGAASYVKISWSIFIPIPIPIPILTLVLILILNSIFVYWGQSPW